MMNSSDNVVCLNDDHFGPAVRGCRDSFDFTQLFERSMLWSLPSAIFIIVSLGRVLYMTRRPRIISAFHLQVAKGTSITAFIALQIALIVVSAGSSLMSLKAWDIAGSLLASVAGCCMLLVSYVDHARSPRSSSLLSTFLFLTILFDTAQVRTLWIASPPHALFAALFNASLAFKIIIFILELLSKSRYINSSIRATLSPEATSNIFNLASYYWLRRLLWRGFGKILTLSDLYPLSGLVSTETAAPRLQRVVDTMAPGELQGNALLYCLFRAFPHHFLLPAVPRAAKIGFSYAQSFLMQSLLSYLGSGQDNITKDRSRGYGLIGAAVFIYGGLAVAVAYKSYFVTRLNSMVRASLCALVYRKVTRLEVSGTPIAAPLTLTSTDVNLIRTGIFNMHEILGNSAEFAIGCWLLYVKVGVAFIVPTIVVFVCLLQLAGALVILGKRQNQWMSKIQTRIDITSNIISSMKSFKMLGLGPRIGNVVHSIRIDEVRAGNRFRVFQLFVFLLSQTPLAIAAPITFCFTSSKLTTPELFGALSYIILLANPLDAIIQDLPNVLTAMVSMKRMQTFLATPEMTPERRSTKLWGRFVSPNEQEGSSGSVALANMAHCTRSDLIFRIQNGTFGWNKEEPVLKHIDLDVKPGTLTIITGAVASGKSTLCSALIGQIPFGGSTVESAVTDLPIGYCASKPFLWNGTIQENIIGYCEFDEKKYNAVLEATMLSVDVAALLLGSETNVGNSGISLSGGQRQRVSLARALYSSTTVYVLDDVLSGLDVQTRNQVFERVLGRNGYIRRHGATAVLCTHAVQYLSEADHVVLIGEHGTIAEQGSPDSLDYQPNKDVITPSDDHDASSDSPETSAERAEAGQDHTSPAVQAGQRRGPVDASRQTGNKRVYSYYLRGMGLSAFVLVVAPAALMGFTNNFSTVWLNFWSADSFHFSRSQYLGIYGSIGGLELALNAVGIGVMLLVAVPRISRRLHLDAINTVVAAPLELYSQTTTGAITNLFSQDLSIVDMNLPLSFINLLVLGMMLIGGLAVVALPSPYLAISYPFVFAALYSLQLFYLRTSRQLRLLDLEAKAPLYNQFLETTEGIATIRSFGWVDKAIARNSSLLNESQRPAYLLSMAQNFLTSTLNIIVAILATATTALATQLTATSGLTGASFVTLFSLSGRMATLMQSYTDMEVSLGAVNRLATFSDSNPPESNKPSPIIPEKSWPASGIIKMNNVSASYKTRKSPLTITTSAQEAPLTLNQISLQIGPREHVALCGRTGSGKSSLLLLLLRLLDPINEDQSIEIDGIPIEQLDRDILRQRLLVVPQDPVFLPPGYTIKQNIDLFDEATDQECIEALEQTQLGALLNNGDGDGSIHVEFRAETLSHGRQQIFGLTRAVVRSKVRARLTGASGGVLILDEPNSKVDQDTDEAMQKVIRSHFAEYSIIYISHRLETVMSLCSRVIVLSQGKIVEQGSPAHLVDTQGSWFGALWQESKRRT